jgi:hypothetical protein
VKVLESSSIPSGSDSERAESIHLTNRGFSEIEKLPEILLAIAVLEAVVTLCYPARIDPREERFP